MILPPEETIRMQYLLERFARECLDHPQLDNHPAPVISSVRDMLIDELLHGAPDCKFMQKHGAELFNGQRILRG